MVSTEGTALVVVDGPLPLVGEVFTEATGAELLAAMGDKIVVVRGEDGTDYGQNRAHEAAWFAQRFANEDRITVAVVNLDTDETILTCQPQVQAEGEAADDVVAGGNPGLADQVSEGGSDDTSAEQSVGDATEGMTGELPPEMGEAGKVAAIEPPTINVLFELVQGEGEGARTIRLDDRSDMGVVLVIDGKVLFSERKAPRVVKPAKPAAEKTERAPRAAKTEPEGKYKQIIDLCARETGASPTELNELTGWTGAPWKWLLHNPKQTGLAQKYGYDFIASKDGRNVRYLLVKKETAPTEADAANDQGDQSEAA